MTCTQLTGNGVTSSPEYDPGNVVGMMQILGLTDSDAGEFFDERESLFERHYKRLLNCRVHHPSTRLHWPGSQ